MKEKVKICFKKIDFIIIITMTILICIGLYCEQQAFILSDEQNTIFIKQLVGIFIGYVLIIVIVLIDYHIICSLSFVLYLIMISILAFTLIFGSDLNNVKRWVVIFGIPFQPSELTKVVLILFLAFLCNHFKNKLDKLFILFILAAVVALPMVLILLEPHLSSSLAILFVFCIIVYSSGISYKVIGVALALILPVVASIFIGIALFNINIPFVEKYQVERVLSFLSADESDSLSGDYQQIQSIEAIGSGGLHGKMISSDGDQNRKYSSIYAKESDFAFAIVGEEFGFVGSLFIIILYALLIIRCLIISSRSSDYMGKQICIGVSAYLVFQIFVNVGVATNLLPNTGLPLPFISYGLTSLISSMIAVGLVLNVGVRKK
ncbi:MAG: Bacterial cell division rane protein [Clostridiaceae bacterium]|nr:Bacterial cell division rane protein [Clostridiaceae bacterium]MDF2949021.1 Bacterial cell division rane protein [Sedimentibacter sp.]